MKTARFHSEAQLEFLDTVAYYEEIQAGLGARFRLAAEVAVALALALPTAGTVYKNGTRRVFPKKFPFSIVYKEIEGGIVIFAVAHFKRRPGYWKNRRDT